MTSSPIERTDSRRSWAALAIGVGAMAVLPIASTGTNVAFPEIEATFDETSRAALSWALSGYSIVIAAFTLLGGQLTDRFDASRVFAAGLVLLVISSALTGFAPTAALLIVGRSAQGVAGAFIVSSSLIVVTREWPVERHVFVIGVWSVSFPIGSSIAPSVSAAVLQVASWRWTFHLIAVLAVVMLGFAVTFSRGAGGASVAVGLGEPTAEPVGGAERRGLDHLGVLMATVAVGLASLGIVQGPSWGWGSAGVIGSLAFAVVLIPLFVIRSRHHRWPVIDLSLFDLRTYAVGSAANVLISMVGTSVWLIWPLQLATEWGYSPIRVGLAISPTPALGSLTSLWAARVAARTGYRSMLLSGSVIIVIANVWFAVVLTETPAFVTAMLPGLLLYGVGMGLTFAPINAAALSDVDPPRYANASAAFNTGRFLAAAIGVAGVVAALGEPSPGASVGYDRAYLLLAMLSGAAFVLLLIAWPARVARSEPSASLG